MLKKFAVANFRGFKDWIELDLSKHRNYEFNEFAIQNGIIRDAIIYGPNGSGKSNLGFAIFDIVNHLTQKLNTVEPNKYSAYAGSDDRIVKYEYTFEFDGQIVEYYYTKFDAHVLVDEKLTVNSKPVFAKENKRIQIDFNSFQMTNETKQSLLKNSNSVSIVNFLLATYPLPNDHYLNKLKTFVNSMLWFRCLEGRGFIGLKTETQILEEFIISNGFIDDFRSFLEEVSGQKYIFKKHLETDKALTCIIDGKEIPFDNVRSTGTSSLTLLYYWLKNIDSASLVFIDEFDAFYHYALSAAVCKRLFSLSCQVFLTSHNTYLMSNDILRPDCNFVIKDNVIKALCDCTDKELRWGHNIEKLFRGGAFDET